MSASSSYRCSVSERLEGSDSAARQSHRFKIWYVFSAVHQVSWGISVKWMLTNVAQLPATTVPFAKILLIATSATAGQVSHSDVLWVSQFTLKRDNQSCFFPLIRAVTGNICGSWTRLLRQCHDKTFVNRNISLCPIYVRVQFTICKPC